MFLHLLLYALLAVCTTVWSHCQAGILSHVTETSRARTRAHGYDNYVKRYRFLSQQKLLRKLCVICCNKYTTLALLTKRRKIRRTRFTPRWVMSHRHLRTRTAEKHICCLSYHRLLHAFRTS